MKDVVLQYTIKLHALQSKLLSKIVVLVLEKEPIRLLMKYIKCSYWMNLEYECETHTQTFYDSEV